MICSPAASVLWSVTMRGLAVAALALSGLAAGAAEPPSAELLKRGEYLANAGDCMGCHTQAGGKPFAGGQSLKTPFGSIAAPNITPDKDTGIGNWTDDQFYKVMHEGIGHKGEYLYPVMPFPWYTTVTRDDVMAIKAYLFAQAPVRQKNQKNGLVFPVSVRTSMLAWRAAFFKAGEFKPDPAQSDEVNRGAYLVNGLGHCGECHNGRPIAGTSRFREALAGGTVDNYYAPNISSDPHDGIGAWSNQEIATYLKTGASLTRGIALGPMAEAVKSLSHLTDADLLAIAAYLKTTPAKSDDSKKLQLYAGRDAPGGDTYLTYCASCHGIQGQGVRGVVPALNGNGSVTAKGPQNVISVVVGGLEAKQSFAPMLAIGAGMTDQEVADVTNYVRQTWGNDAPATAQAGQVAELRKKAVGPMTGARDGQCPDVAPAPLAKALADDRTGLARELATLNESDLPQHTQRIVATVKKAAPGVAQADLVNGLTAAYCKVVQGDPSLDGNQRILRLGHFATLAHSATITRVAAGAVANDRSR